MSSPPWAVSPDAITEVIPRITAPLPRIVAPIAVQPPPVAMATGGPTQPAPIPFRPWRMIWCALSLGHFWWPGGVNCLDCGWKRKGM